MEIYSETGYLIIMDPWYLQLSGDNISTFDFLKIPKQAAIQLEKMLFSDEVSSKIGLIVLQDGPGRYRIDKSKVSFWDVEKKSMKNRTIFGVEFGSFIIFDIHHINNLIQLFNKQELEAAGEQSYFNQLKRKLSKKGSAIVWCQSDVGIGDGWHEITYDAFQKC